MAPMLYKYASVTWVFTWSIHITCTLYKPTYI